jgi:hypothetical protein
MVLLAGIVLPARAGTLSGKFSGVTLLSTLDPTVIASQSFIGGGIDSTYGNFTATAQSTVDSTHPPQILFSGGTLLFNLSQGTGAFQGTYTGSATDNGNGTSFTIDVSITSGSGVFTGATGTVLITGDLTEVNRLPNTTRFVVAGTYIATFAIPEPNTLTLLAPAVAGGAIVLLHRRRRKATAPSIGPSAII